VVEQGIKMVSMNWFVVVAPAKTPQVAVDRQHAGLVRASQSPEVKEHFEGIAVESYTHSSPDAFQKFIRDDYARWGKVVKDLNVAAQL
jgi:tripartite-type tricarboxylate transporter receptor subunit TctC